jgi:hypothetical protein
MRRHLPTTMAAIRYRCSGDQVECTALWAGDSRAYALTPRAGLQALTRDHTVETDALEQLLQDPPMTNVLAAGQEFMVDSHSIRLASPVMVVCATDGFFGYVDTPAHFECHLLDTLMSACDERDWAQRLTDRVIRYTGDDASLSLVALGYRNFAELRGHFGRRAEEVKDRYWTAPQDGDTDRERLRQWRERTWRLYRQEYERLMPPPRGEQEP